MENEVMSLKDFEACVAKLSKEDLERYLVDLFKSSRQNQEAMTVALKGQDYGAALLRKYKRKLREAYYGRSYGDRIFVDKAEKVLNEFKEVCGVESPNLYIELGLYFAKFLIESIKDECYEYSSVEVALDLLYEDLCKRVSSDSALFQTFKPKFLEILEMASVGCDFYEIDLETPFKAIPWVIKECPDGFSLWDYIDDQEEEW